ncbi:hypothetical protein AQJ46_11185 [Streptomyces canus]|uniref:Uncharacterized protein n=1 Tax=Streptomyces canus TaxID=58343 RepID=A0A124I025_9ACTN|nr:MULTISPECIES: hypothetical protein [Streptomyces]KUN72945.1 hypothetical protein AQJ46_11185 [Streptomyces canus]MDI5910193.1 hypothetical protein [Streptomyces sp. 12257]
MSEWYVLVETNNGWSDGNWLLHDKVHVAGGREQAVARAEELTRSNVERRTGDDPHRGHLVFRTSETSWLLEFTKSRWSEPFDHATEDSSYARISVAELISSAEARPVERPAPEKGRLRRAFGG